jgi:hypothetical protein
MENKSSVSSTMTKHIRNGYKLYFPDLNAPVMQWLRFSVIHCVSSPFSLRYFINIIVVGISFRGYSPTHCRDVNCWKLYSWISNSLPGRSRKAD